VPRFARILVGTAVASVAMLFSGPSATGAIPSADRGDGNGGRTQAQIQTGENSGSGMGALPFSGTDLALAASGAVLLFVAGAAMAWRPAPVQPQRRATRQSPIRPSVSWSAPRFSGHARASPAPDFSARSGATRRRESKVAASQLRK
jgi:hypothetical protein